MAYRGALMHVALVKPGMPNHTRTLVAFDCVLRDTDGFVTDQKTFTVPEGVSKVRLKAQVVWDAFPPGSNVGLRQIVIKKNATPGPAPNYEPVGGWTPGWAVSNSAANGQTTHDHQAISPVLDVVPGDYFQLEALQVNPAMWTVYLNTGGGTWFEIEVVE